jgi:hypothetical protein
VVTKPLQVHEIAVANGEKSLMFDSDDDDGDDNDNDDNGHSSITRTDLLDLCRQIEVGCMQYGDTQFSLNLSINLRIFRGTYPTTRRTDDCQANFFM